LRRGVLHHDVHGLVDGALGHGEGVGMHPGDFHRQLARFAVQFGQRHGAVHHAALLGCVSQNGLGGEQHFLGLARAKLPRVAMIFHIADPHQHHRIGEPRIAGRDNQIARPRE